MLYSNQDLRRLLWPLVMEQLLLVLVGMADTVMVSSVNESAVSGVALVEVFNVLLINLFTALAAGGTVVAGQYLGRKDSKNAEIAAKQLFYVVGSLATLLCIVCVAANRGIIRLFYGELEPDVLQAARTYFYLTALSYPAMGIYNCGAAMFRAIGNSRVSMCCSMLMNVINIGGNAILIYGFHMGVLGAGIATLVSRIVAAIVVFILLCKNEQGFVFTHPFRFVWQGRMVKNILRVGIPSGLENSMFQIGKLLVQGLIAGMSTAAIAADAVANNLAAIGNIFGNGIGIGMMTVVSHCLGAGEKGQAVSYIKRLLRYNYLAIMPIDLCLFLFAEQLAGLFSLSPEGIGLAALMLRIYAVAAVLIWPLAWGLPYALRAAGDARFTMITALVSMWSCRILLSYLFVYWGWGLSGIWIAMDIDWIVRMMMFVWRFRRRRWLSKKVIS